MEETGIPKLTPEQVEKLCEMGEKAAREYVLSKVPLRKISDLDVTLEISGLKPITVNIDLRITLSPLMKGYDVQKLADEAKEKAFLAVEEYLRKLTCKSKE